MKPKKKAVSIAAKAVQKAVDEQTLELQQQGAAKDRRIAELEASLRSVGAMALRAVGDVKAPEPPLQAPPILLVEEPPADTGPSVDLAHNDNLGEGRWV